MQETKLLELQTGQLKTQREAVVVYEAAKRFGAPSLSLGRWAPASAGKAPAGEQAAWALDHVSFTVHPGEIFGLWGASGAGKSTLIRLLATLLAPDEGDLQVYGYSVRNQPGQVRRLVNPVTAAGFFKKLSPVENLLHSARQEGLPVRRERALDLLNRLGLEDELAYQPMEAMPRSLQAKVSLARALLGAPKVLLLDEPTAGLEEETRQEIHTLLRALRNEEGLTILLATRDWAEADDLCDRVAVLESGRIVEIETTGCIAWPGAPFKYFPHRHGLPVNPAEIEAVCN